MYRESMKKFLFYQFGLLGHSQSGVIVSNLYSNNVRNCISLHPAYINANFFKNEFIIRSTGDMVSQFVAQFFL
jgi:hypothetical protein